MKNLNKMLVSSILFGLAGMASSARADILTFQCITNTNASNCQSGSLQLSVEVLAAANGQAQFIFRNVGSTPSSITDVYFDDGTLLGIASVTNGSGVNFSQGASPPNLPGGNSIDPAFQTTAGFTADSNPPTQPNGVNPGETLSIFFYLQSGGTFQDVIRELYTRELRIGIHVQGFANGGSESFVNLQPVPVPAAAWMLLSGIGVLGATRRRRLLAETFEK